MNIKMLNNNVLVTLENVNNVTESGIILNPSASKNYNTAVVKAVPDNQEFVSVGEKVCIPLYAGVEYIHEGVLYHIINLKEIIFVV